MKKVWMYVDGPNFYYSIKEPTQNNPLGWCDFRKLAEQHFLEQDTVLERINYFTAPVRDLGRNNGEEKRQNDWLKAVRTIPGVRIFSGFYSGRDPNHRREKQTDVNIAVRLILDAFQSQGYDSAILVSGDTDLIPAVKAVQKEVPGKKSIMVCVPMDEPSHYWTDLAMTEGTVVKKITTDMLLHSRLPEFIPSKPDNVYCPERWKLK